MGSRAAKRKSQRRLHRRPGTASQRHGWPARLPQRRTCSCDPPGEKSRGLAQDQVLVLEPLHLAPEAKHFGFIRFLLGQRLSRASRKLLIAPLAELARADIQLRRDVGEWQATLDQALNRLGLILAGKPPPGSRLCHSILLGCLGSLQNPPLHRGKPTRRLATIPGIGVLNATALVAAIGTGEAFGRGRDLAAWLGLVPRQATTGGKPRLLGISKRGNGYLRKMLIHGARAALPTLSQSETPLGGWLRGLLARAHVNTAVVALAAEPARIIRAVLRSGQAFEMRAAAVS